MIKTREELNDAYRLLHGDLNTLFKLVFTYRKPLSEADIRLASVILRKWLTDGLLGECCNFASTPATFFALDNSERIKEVEAQPSISYFLTGGVRFQGTPVQSTYYSSLNRPDKPLITAEPLPEREFSIGAFMKQRRLFFEGTWFTCEDIIKFTANKLGGAHYDLRRDGRFEALENAAKFMLFGGPLPETVPLPAQVYLTLEGPGAEPLSAVHIEIVAAASSFIQVHLAGTPVLRLVTKTSTRTRIRRLFGLDKPGFRMDEPTPRE